MRTITVLTTILLAAAGHAQVTHELQVEDDEFNPPSLTINLGDHVHIYWDNSVVNPHTFTQVAQATWNVNGNTPLAGGYDLGFGTPNPGTDFTITPAATVWYVCSYHASMGMKGVINVLGTTGVAELAPALEWRPAPVPASSTLSFPAAGAQPVTIRLFDASGRMVLTTLLDGDRSVDVTSLPNGCYVAGIQAMNGSLLSRQRVVIAH